MSPDVTIQQVIDFGSIKSVKLHTVEVLRELIICTAAKQTNKPKPTAFSRHM